MSPESDNLTDSTIDGIMNKSRYALAQPRYTQSRKYLKELTPKMHKSNN